MRIKQTLKSMIFATSLVFAIFAIFTPVTALAAPTATTTCDPATQTCCGGVQTSIVTCGQTGGKDTDIKNSGVWGILLLGINILTAGVGVVAVAGIVYASILYTTSAGEADKVKKAITIISDIVIGIVAYALMYAALNFLVPGGLFTSP